ncbi:MAG: Gfo/Idh/MocA family oxidoreductase [Deltaproteobacteria bacterium]|nr:Gfo/Idh/MocA family oxidoreductase [Deltaproteobacteria bacterium]
MEKLRVGITGAGFIGQVHYDAFSKVIGAEVVAIADVDKKRRDQFAKRNNIRLKFDSLKQMAESDEVDVITLGVPNYLHKEFAVTCMKNGKHVIIEKPLCLTLDEADEIIEVSKKSNRYAFYAEELCFIPKFVRAKEIVDAGGIGRPYMIKEWEKHAGPYSPWFFKRETAGGGIMMDMGCHAIEFARWFLNKPKVKSVYAQVNLVLHKKITKLDDNVIILIEFENGVVANLEASWALKGGMDSVMECYGTEGVIYADLLRGGGIKCYSERGFTPNPEESRGWTFPEYDWNYQNGYPQEMQHFIDCILHNKEPMESAKDGKVVLEIMIAAYLSAATGKKIEFPLKVPYKYKYPVDLWLYPLKR